MRFCVSEMGVPLRNVYERLLELPKFSMFSIRKPPIYPNFNVWPPVRYDAVARHVFGLSQSLAQFAERYVKFGMPPFPTPPMSVTLVRCSVGLRGDSYGPHGDA